MIHDLHGSIVLRLICRKHYFGDILFDFIFISFPPVIYFISLSFSFYIIFITFNFIFHFLFSIYRFFFF